MTYVDRLHTHIHYGLSVGACVRAFSGLLARLGFPFLFFNNALRSVHAHKLIFHRTASVRDCICGCCFCRCSCCVAVGVSQCGVTILKPYASPSNAFVMRLVVRLTARAHARWLMRNWDARATLTTFSTTRERVARPADSFSVWDARACACVVVDWLDGLESVNCMYACCARWTRA